jgi:thiamine-monophosphate kinase
MTAALISMQISLPRGMMAELVRELGELGLIEKLREIVGAAGEGVVAGIGDDAAVIDLDGMNYLLLSDDAFLDRVHFDLRTWSASQIGGKAMAATLSDIAAMGGTARTCLVSLLIPASLEIRDLEELYRGLVSMAGQFAVSIVGGNVVSAERLGLCLTVTGHVEKTKVCLRSTARLGDAVAVTGDLGRSEAGRLLLAGDISLAAGHERAVDSLRQKHLAPVPRLKCGASLAGAVDVGAMIDISDGLAREVHHITLASGVGARIEESKLPILEETRLVAQLAGIDASHLALGSGEEFELMFTLHPAEVEIARSAIEALGVAFTTIGEIVPRDAGVRLIEEDGTSSALAPEGWDHFRA